MSQPETSPFVARVDAELKRLASACDQLFTVPPHKRDLADIDRLLADAKSTLALIDQVPAAARDSKLARLHRIAKGCVEFLRGAHAVTEHVARASTEELTAGLYASGAYFLFARLGRHLARRSPVERDIAFLEEIAAALQRFEAAIVENSASLPNASFDGSLAMIRGHLARLQEEIAATREAQSPGTDAERGRILRALIDAQHALYEHYFVDHDLVTRRPALLSRIITTVRGLDDELRVVDPTGALRGSIDDRLATYEADLARLREARKTTSLETLARLLADEGKRVIEKYNASFVGKPRTDVDIALLDQLCEEMCEVAQQLVHLGRGMEDPEGSRQVMGWLFLLEQEFLAVRQAQAK